MKKLIITIAILLLSNQALSKTCKSVSDNLLEFYKSSLYACTTYDNSHCSKSEDSHTKTSIIDFDFGKRKSVTAGLDPKNHSNWIFTYSNSQESAADDSTDATIKITGEYSIIYNFSVSGGECSLNSISISFLPDRELEDARKTHSLNQKDCAQIDHSYLEESKLGEQHKNVLKGIKSADICHHAINNFWPHVKE